MWLFGSFTSVHLLNENVSEDRGMKRGRDEKMEGWKEGGMKRGGMKRWKDEKRRDGGIWDEIIR